MLAAQEGVVTLHDIAGLPWRATILLTTVTARELVTLPFGLSEPAARLGHRATFVERRVACAQLRCAFLAHLFCAHCTVEWCHASGRMT